MVSRKRYSLRLWVAATVLCGCSPVVIGSDSPGTGTGGASGGGASGVANTASGSGGGSAAPQVLWNRRFGENDFNNGDGPFGNHGVYAFAMDSQGAAILAGGSIGSIDFGDDEIPAAPFESGWVAKLDPEGTTLWSRGFPCTGNIIVTSLAVDGADAIIAAGYFVDTVDFGDGATQAPAGGWGYFVMKLDAQGAITWSRVFDAVDGGWSWDVGAFPNGDSVVVGSDSTELGPASFWARFDADGNLAASGAVDYAGSLATRPDGSFAVAGRTSDGSGFFTRYDSLGGVVSTHVFPGSHAVQGRDLTLRADGSAVLVMTSSGSPDFGGGPIDAEPFGSTYVAGLGPGDEHLFSSRVIMTPGYQPAVGVDDSGSFLGGGGVVAQVGPDGALLWTKTYAASLGDQDGLEAIQIWGVGRDAQGNHFVAGKFVGALDFGMGPMQSPSGASNAFVAKLGPNP